MFIAGFVVFIVSPFLVCAIAILILGIVGETDNAMNNILINRYLGNFASKEMLSNIYSANAIARNFMRMIIGMAGSWVIGVTTSVNSMMIGDSIFLVISILLIIYMKSRVGLKPDEYKEKEIKLEII